MILLLIGSLYLILTAIFEDPKKALETLVPLVLAGWLCIHFWDALFVGT